MSCHPIGTSLSSRGTTSSSDSADAASATSPSLKRKRIVIQDILNPQDTDGVDSWTSSNANKKLKSSGQLMEPSSPLSCLHNLEQQSDGPAVLDYGRREGSEFGMSEFRSSRRAQKRAVKGSKLSDDICATEAPCANSQNDSEALQQALNQLQHAETQIAGLQRTLIDSKKRFDHQQVATKQSMMLDYLMLKETITKKNLLHAKEKYMIQIFANDRSKEVDQLQAKIDNLVERYTEEAASYTKELATCRQDLQHRDTEIIELFGDLQDLRQLENEEAAHRRKHVQGLPPAYGEHLERDQKPPYEHHADMGSADFYMIKEAIRTRFTVALKDAHFIRAEWQRDGNPCGRAEADSIIFRSTSHAFFDACRLLKSALSSTTEKPIWIADQILELSWLLLGACELRPSNIFHTVQEKNRLALGYQEADECLLEVFQEAFKTLENEVLGAYTLQSYLTQINAIRTRLIVLKPRDGYDHFIQTVDWLEERVCHERIVQANLVLDGNASVPSGMT